MQFDNLYAWLDWQSTLHPREVELGLERVDSVWEKLYRGTLSFKVITVAGTNGKGSCVAMLEAILRAAGYRTGCYTSPHLLRYNERIRVDGREATDERICQAFERVDRARGEISLTYFEFATLAALEIFVGSHLDLVILEVGLGGRLDAVNIIDSDLALISSIGRDHTDWLGETEAEIALEKAGILRAGRPAVFGGVEPPAVLEQRALELGAPLAMAGRDYQFRQVGRNWEWQNGGHTLNSLPLPHLRGAFQLQNAAAVLMVLELLREAYPIGLSELRAGLQNVRLQGRFQLLPGPIPVILDVAHNTEAAQALAGNLAAMPCAGRTLAVFSSLSDKDVVAIAGVMTGVIDAWYLGSLEGGRAKSLEALAKDLRGGGVAASDIHLAGPLVDAFKVARKEAVEGDRVVVFGSFLTVSGVLQDYGA